MRSGYRPDHCVVRVGRVTLNLYPYVTHPVTDSRLIYRLWFGGLVLPEEEAKKFYPMKPKEHRERKYFFDLTEDGDWGCGAGKNEPVVSSEELADHCINELLDFHDAVESRRISSPN